MLNNILKWLEAGRSISKSCQMLNFKNSIFFVKIQFTATSKEVFKYQVIYSICPWTCNAVHAKIYMLQFIIT